MFNLETAKYKAEAPTHRIKDIYSSIPSIPAGWSAVGFRLPLNGDWYLGTLLGNPLLCDGDDGTVLPRIIVVPTPGVFECAVSDIYAKPFWELTAPAGHEFTGEFRLPTPNDLVLSWNREYAGRMPGAQSVGPRLILKKV